MAVLSVALFSMVEGDISMMRVLHSYASALMANVLPAPYGP